MFENIKSHPMFPVLVLILICIIAYCITIHYNKKEKMINSAMLIQLIQNTKYEMPDERKIREMIELPNRNPMYLTSNMVVPSNLSSEEQRKESRMEVLNMFYNNGIDDRVSIHARPQNLYVIP
jgi:hypothetical protein